MAKKQIRGLFDYLALKEGEDWGFSPQDVKITNVWYGPWCLERCNPVGLQRVHARNLRENMDHLKKSW